MRNIGILGCGHIAEKMAATINNMDGYQLTAVASRSFAKAQEFAKRFGSLRAYGSYEELLNDSDINLVYVATPNSLHYAHAKMCIMKDKAVLVEKPFTADADEAKKLIDMAKERHIFIAEAIWPRYQPLMKKISQMANDGTIGRPYTITCNLCYPISHKERLQSPALAGGTLLDIGVYALNFTAMIFGKDIERTVSACTKTKTGMDDQEMITQFFADRRMSVMTSSMYPRSDRNGVISGDKGYIMVDNINNPSWVRVFDLSYNLLDEKRAMSGLTGFEYEVQACFEAMEKGEIEPHDMPHDETLRIMQMMDELRAEWGVQFTP